MHTSTQQPRAHRGTRAKTPIYPDLPSSDSPLGRFFWLAAFLRDQAELEAINGLIDKPSHIKSPRPLRMALYGALRTQENDLSKSLSQVCSNGLLPFAHQQTTVFNGSEALQ